MSHWSKPYRTYFSPLSPLSIIEKQRDFFKKFYRTPSLSLTHSLIHTQSHTKIMSLTQLDVSTRITLLLHAPFPLVAYLIEPLPQLPNYSDYIHSFIHAFTIISTNTKCTPLPRSDSWVVKELNLKSILKKNAYSLSERRHFSSTSIEPVKICGYLSTHWPEYYYTFNA